MTIATSTSISMEMYPTLFNSLKECSERERVLHLRFLARTDLYLLLRYILNRPDVEDPWLFARCREVQNDPNGHLDLWAREHYKSTIITFAKSIQDILASHGEGALPEWEGRETTIGIFSFNRGIALDFVAQIKKELEDNETLKYLFPDILWASETEAKREAKSWSEMGGICVKRQGNPKESTLEGWGLIDSMPTGRHFFERIYDDVITERYARSPDMIKKSIESWELSLNLGARGGLVRYIGTRYHYNDAYRTILERNAAKPRIYPATDDGTVNGVPVYLTPKELARKRAEMGPYVFGCQMLQDPKADEIQGFLPDWLRYWEVEPAPNNTNFYILVDPANEKKKTSDYTAMAVIGLGYDGNYYLVDLVRDRMNLTERTDMLFHLHQKWRPKGVGYEKYGKDSDISHIETEMEHRNYRFSIEPLGGSMKKEDRIRRLIPLFEQGRFYIPQSLRRTLHDGLNVDLIEQFIYDEYDAFPVAPHDDMLDCIARIVDEALSVTWPKTLPELDRYEESRRRRRRSAGRTWRTR